MRMPCHVEEVQLAVAPLQLSARLELEEPRDQSVLRVKHERVQHARRPRTMRRGVLGQGKLKKRVQLDALAAAARIFEDHTAGVDVAGTAKAEVEVGRGR